MATSPEERALALIEGFPQKGPPRDQREWPKIQEGMKQAVRDGDQDMLFALHHASGDRELLGGWPRETAWRSAGLIPEATALRRFLERAKNPPAFARGREPQLADGPARILGAMLAHAQDDELLERELEHFGPEPALQNVFACWIQERVLRGSLIGRSAFAQQFWRALRPDHRLRSLPLEALAIEEGLVAQSTRRIDAHHSWFERGSDLKRDGFGPEGEWSCSVEELPAEPKILAAAVADPALCPNTEFEGRVFQLRTRPPALKALSMRSLGLECLGTSSARVKACDARHALGMLLMLGNGGVYAEAESGAFARLLAWRSLTALVDLPEGTPHHDVEARAETVEWLAFESTSPWFCHVTPFDVGLVALRPDNSLAVLATTDTD